MKVYKMAKMDNTDKMDNTEKVKILDLVERIKKGHTNWDLEEQQLYQNNAKEIEALLRGSGDE